MVDGTAVVVVAFVVDGRLVVEEVEFFLDESVVLRFTVTFVDATGFLVVFITVDVAFFVGLTVLVSGLFVTFTVLPPLLLDGLAVVIDDGAADDVDVDADATDVLFSG